MDIRKLLQPKKTAVIGASDKEGFGGDTCRNMIRYMKPEDYYFVNPKRDQVQGVKCYPSISHLPEPVELLVIATPMSTVEDCLRQGAKKGVKAAVVFASGYSEVGTDEGAEAEAQLQRLCKELDIALMGPNCAGYANYTEMIYPYAFISNERERQGSVGVVSQSGQLVLSMMESPNIRFSYAISSGNGNITTMEDYLDFLIEDEATQVIALYMEGSKQPAKLAAALKKSALKRKPIVVLKTGRSEKGQALAASHTGSLSGSDKVFDALFEKFGVIRVDDLEELISTAQALAVLNKLPETSGFSSISLSGGETGICADLSQMFGLDYPDFSQETTDVLRAILPAYATVNNPLDSTASLSYDIDKFSSVCAAVMKDPAVGLLTIGYTLLEEISDNAIYYMTAALERVMKEEWAKPCLMLPFAENTRNQAYVKKLEAIGIPVLPTSLYAMKIVKNILNFAAYQPQDHQLDIAILSSNRGNAVAKSPPLMTTEQGEQVPSAAEKETKTQRSVNVLTESESKTLVQQYGIDCGIFAVAHSRVEAGQLFSQLRLTKAVAKVDSPDILHKSDAGCVILNLTSPEEVMDAYDLILQNAANHFQNPEIKGVQICQMADQGTEVILGVNNDPQFGPCVLVGLGGVFVEIFQDTAMALAPVSRQEADGMIRKLKSFRLLDGYRGSPKRDVASLAETILHIAQLAADYADQLKELDINPVFVYENGLCAVDALCILRRPS